MKNEASSPHTELMFPQFDGIKLFAEGWLKTRFVLPVIFVLAGALLWASETTHSGTSAALHGGIQLTDARIKSLRLLQLLTEAETAKYAYLVDGNPAQIARYAALKTELKASVDEVMAFFAERGASGEAVALKVLDLTRLKLDHIDRTLELAQSGNTAAAVQLAKDERYGVTRSELRGVLDAQLAEAALLQNQTRTSIYKALDLNRAAVGLLTFSTLLSLLWLVRQLSRQDRERTVQQTALLKQREHLEIEVQRRTTRLSELAKHLQSVRENERAHLARELHDELGALLTACKLEIARARMKKAEPDNLQLGFERMNGHLNAGIALKRRIIEDLRPSALSNLGLNAALENLCAEMSERLEMKVELFMADFSLAPEADLAVYRFVQEALTNVGKHANASQVTVTLKVVGRDATVEVTDNGVGFEPKDLYVGHHGLSGMQFRAESLGGSMQVTSSLGHGCTVRIEFAQLAAAVPV